MNKIKRLRAHTATANRRDPHRAPLSPTRRRSERLVSEAVVAEYIHDISKRHRHLPTPQPASEG